MLILDADTIKESRITITLILINIFCFIAFNMILPVDYLLLLVQKNDSILENQELWRLITSMFLHADVFHLFSNCVALLIFGAAVEGEYSKIEYLIIFFISGLIGNVFSLFLLPYNAISLGASGAVFGLIGAAFVLFVREDPSFLFLGVLYLVYFIMMGLEPGINIFAHLFGLAGGILFGYLFNLKRKDEFENYY